MCFFLYRKLEIIKKNIHIGKLLQQAVKQTGLNVDLITKKAGYKRGTFYLHIKQKDLDINILKKYALAIGYDFSREVPAISEFMLAEEDHPYAKEPTTISEAMQQRDEWKEKYYALMEKYLKYVENNGKG
ncbi:MAG: hypothetical protein ABI168_02415 [Ginsengibacter sp.]